MKRWTLFATLAAAALAAVVAVGQSTPAFADEHEGDAKAVVGTFNQQQALQPYSQHFMAKRQKISQEIQKEMQAGGEGGNNRQKMMQARQKMQKRMQAARDEVRQRIDDDLAKVLPKVAEDAGVDVIVPEVSYKTDAVQTKDVSQQVTKALGEIAPKTQPTGAAMPGRGQGQKAAGQGKANKGQGQGQGKNQ
jgi:uncharacterized FlaG/YvyC family protein